MKRTRRSTSNVSDHSDVPSKAAKLGESKATVSDPASASCSNDDVQDKVCFIDRLPDHLVVRIFQELELLKDIATLLPQVCKRWQLLASHENLWKDVHLSYESHMSESQKKMFFKCLQMAPKLSSITFELEYRDGPDFAQRIIKKCPSEVVALHFIYDNLPPAALFSLLKKYKNCLEKLMITDTYTPYVDEDVKRIWKEILNLTKLKHLVVDGAALFYHKATFRKAAPCWTTWQILDVKDCSYENMNTVQKLISVHPNWIEVYLSTTTSSIFRGEVKALSKCTSLETIQVPFCKEFKLLEKCERLDSIIVDCVDETSSEVSNVLPVLAQTNVFPLLKTVKIIGGGSVYAPLLMALVKGRPKISLLNLVSCDMKSEELLDVLENTPSLKTLYFHEMSAQCVSAVVNGASNNVLSNLEKLSLFECYCDEESKLCVKVLAKELEQHQKIKVTIESIVCSCKP